MHCVPLSFPVFYMGALTLKLAASACNKTLLVQLILVNIPWVWLYYTTSILTGRSMSADIHFNTTNFMCQSASPVFESHVQGVCDSRLRPQPPQMFQRSFYRRWIGNAAFFCCGAGFSGRFSIYMNRLSNYLEELFVLVEANKSLNNKQIIISFWLLSTSPRQSVWSRSIKSVSHERGCGRGAEISTD